MHVFHALGSRATPCILRQGATGTLASSFSVRKLQRARGGAFTASQIAPVSMYVLGACACYVPSLLHVHRSTYYSATPFLVALNLAAAAGWKEKQKESVRQPAKTSRAKRRKVKQRTETERSRTKQRERAQGSREKEWEGRCAAWGAIAARHSKPANGRASSHGTGLRLKTPTRSFENNSTYARLSSTANRIKGLRLHVTKHHPKTKITDCLTTAN